MLNLEKLAKDTIWNENYPCRNCNLYNQCATAEVECKAFRMYCNVGSWKDKDIGNLLREFPIQG